MKTIQIKRIYDAVSPGDGYRMLVDRLWPRGVSKTGARLDEWNREVAPSAGLRKWFGHMPERFPEFARRYRRELNDHEDLLERIRIIAEHQNVTLLFAAKDKKHNHAVVLCDVLTGR